MPPLLRKLKPGQKAEVFRPRWRGVAPDVKPSKLQQDQPYLALNVRLEGGEAVLRGGQRRIVNLGGQVTGLATHKIGASKSLFFSDQADLDVFDEEFVPIPTIQDGCAPEWDSAFAFFGTDLVFGDLEDGIPVIKKYNPGAGAEHPIILKLPDNGYGSRRLTAMLEHEGVLLIALTESATLSSVYSFDGITLTKEIAGMTGYVGAFYLWRDKALALPSTLAPLFDPRLRSAAGAWTTLAPISGLTVYGGGNNYAYRYASFRDVLYIALPQAVGAADDGSCYSFNGTTVVSIPSTTTGITNSGFTNSQIQGFTVLDGVLYYLWFEYIYSPTPVVYVAAYIGMFDGTTWTPKYKDLTSQASYPNYLESGSTSFDFNYALSMAACRGSLVVGAAVRPPSSGAPIINNASLLFSPLGGDVSGTWARLLVGTDAAITPPRGIPVMILPE